MKITFGLTVEPRVHPFTYYEHLARSFYDRTPSYELHDDMSLHSIGWIRGQADATRRGLVFSRSSTWSVGIVHKDVLQEFLSSIETDPEIIPGIRIDSATPVRAQAGRVRYLAESPILIRRESHHYRFDEPEGNRGLTYSLRTKLKAIGIDEAVCATVRATFDTDYARPRTKVVHIGKAKYLTSVCPIYIDAQQPLLHELAMSAGLGGLTGMGLGAILPANQASA